MGKHLARESDEESPLVARLPFIDDPGPSMWRKWGALGVAIAVNLVLCGFVYLQFKPLEQAPPPDWSEQQPIDPQAGPTKKPSVKAKPSQGPSPVAVIETVSGAPAVQVPRVASPSATAAVPAPAPSPTAPAAAPSESAPPTSPSSQEPGAPPSSRVPGPIESILKDVLPIL